MRECTRHRQRNMDIVKGDPAVMAEVGQICFLCMFGANMPIALQMQASDLVMHASSDAL